MASSAVSSAAAPAADTAADRRNARWYLTGLGASVLGDSALSLAAGIWVKALTGSSTLAALVSVCVYAPTLAAPLAGLLADRVRRRSLLIAINATMAGVVATLLAVRSAADVWLIFAVMAVYGAALTATDPAESALFAIMLPTRLRQRINGVRLTLTEGGKLTAPLLGAGLFALLGGGPVAALDAATSVVAAFTTSRLRVSEPRPADRPVDPTPWRTKVLAAFTHLRSRIAAGALLRATGWLPAAMAGSLVLGFALPWSVLAVINLTQRRTPDALQGRVAAVVTLALFAPLPLTQAIGAGIIGPFGYRGVYLLNAALVLLTAIWLSVRTVTTRQRE